MKRPKRMPRRLPVDNRVFTDAELRVLAARSLRRLITFIAATIDDIAADLGDDAAHVTVAELLAPVQSCERERPHSQRASGS